VANIKSSQKADRQRVTRTARNVAHTTAMRTAIKKLRAALGGQGSKGGAKNLGPLLKSAVQAIDKAASKGVIKKGTASRSVSRLTVAVSGASAAK
jgi:small subunit ribosomal protein S20